MHYMPRVPAALLLGLYCASYSVAARAADEKPNVLFFLIESAAPPPRPAAPPLSHAPIAAQDAPCSLLLLLRALLCTVCTC